MRTLDRRIKQLEASMRQAQSTAADVLREFTTDDLRLVLAYTQPDPAERPETVPEAEQERRVRRFMAEGYRKLSDQARAALERGSDVQV